VVLPTSREYVGHGKKGIVGIITIDNHDDFSSSLSTFNDHGDAGGIKLNCNIP
jgi:hypothetical protein